jgi:hypothetical protein
MTTIITRSGKGAALTHTEVDANFTNLNADKAEVSAVILATQKGAASGVAPLDATSKILATYLPSYVDDVLEYANYAGLPVTGETGKIYVALDTNKTYRWSGSAYIYITSGAVDSVAGKTGVVTLTASDVGLGNVTNNAAVANLSGTNTGDQTLPTSLPASDVYAWAKAATKPTYTYTEVGAQPAGTYATGTGSASGVNTGDQTNISGNAAGLSVTLAVNKGGTGLTSVGSSGNVLTSNGTSWVSSAPSGGGSLLRQTVFTASGTWTKGAGTTKILAQGVGGGGGGGAYFSSGAGAGGYANKFIDVAAISTVSVTIGSGGAGGSGANGTAGGTTYFGSHFTCNGGMGGQYNSAYPSIKGGLGGSASGGDVNISGGCGGSGVKGTPSYFNYSTGGIGASSFYGGGGAAAQYDGVAENGYAAGSGGGGTGYNSGGVYTGGTGANGIVIILEFA